VLRVVKIGAPLFTPTMSDGFLGWNDALAKAANRAAKGTAMAASMTFNATEELAKGTASLSVAAAKVTYQATENVTMYSVEKTITYTGKFQSSVTQAMNVGPSSVDGADEHDAETAEAVKAQNAQRQQEQARAAPKRKTAAERRKDRADYVIFDTATPKGRTALRQEAVTAIDANFRLREKLRVSEGARAEELERLLRQYNSRIARYEGKIASTVQAGADGQERLDLAGQVCAADSACMRVFSHMQRVPRANHPAHGAQVIRHLSQPPHARRLLATPAGARACGCGPGADVMLR